MTEAVHPVPPEPRFTLGAALGYGWKGFERHAGQILGSGFALLVPFVVLTVVGFVGAVATEHGDGTFYTDISGDQIENTVPTTGGVLILLACLGVMFFLAIIINAGTLRASLRVMNNEPFGFGELLSFRRFFSVLIASLLLFVGTVIGLVFCLVPGILFAFLARYTLWFVIDKEQGPLRAMASSMTIVRNNLGPSILFVVIGWMLSALAYNACVIGTVVALPVLQLATGYTYRALLEEPVPA